MRFAHYRAKLTRYNAPLNTVLGALDQLDQESVIAFCKHCSWSYECWLLIKTIYVDDHPQQEFLKDSLNVYFFERLWKILQEYWLNEVAKLGDPAQQGRFRNLSISYIQEAGTWPADVKPKIDETVNALLEFTDKLASARNKILAHKDVDIVVSNTTLGRFNEGDDEAFFETLQEFVDTVHDIYIGGPYPFDTFARTDVYDILQRLELGSKYED